MYIKGYEEDAAVDIVIAEDYLSIKPGFQIINLKTKYTPAPGEVAFLLSRGSTANKGIFPIMVAIDANYDGTITAWVVNVTNVTQVFSKDDRVFSIVNLKLGEDRVPFTVSKTGKRNNNKLGSSGGTHGRIS